MLQLVSHKASRHRESVKLFNSDQFPDEESDQFQSGYGNENGNEEEQQWNSNEFASCASGCSVQWLGDGTCDLACNSQICGFDAGDCPDFAEQITNASMITKRLLKPGDMVKTLQGGTDDEEIGTILMKTDMDFSEKWPYTAIILDPSKVFGKERHLSIECHQSLALKCLQLPNSDVMVLIQPPNKPSKDAAILNITIQGFSLRKDSVGPVQIEASVKLWPKNATFDKSKLKSAFGGQGREFSEDGGFIPFHGNEFNEDMYGSDTNFNQTRPEDEAELDIFGKSIRFVDSLLNEAYGTVEDSRSVIAHMPHLIDKRVVQLIEEKWPDEMTETSAHRFRNERDMQFAFTYFYYLMNEARDVSFMELWVQLDTDEDGSLNENEIRSMVALIEDLDEDHPLNSERIEAVKKEIIEANGAGLLSSEITASRLSNTPSIVQRLVNAVSPNNVLGGIDMNYELASMDQVTFLMLKDNATEVLHRLDSIRKKRTKFVCINDNMNTTEAKAENLEILHDFYDSMYPLPSSFELQTPRKTPLFMSRMSDKATPSSDKTSYLHGYSVVFVSSLLFVPSAPFVGLIVYYAWKRRKNRSRSRAQSRGGRQRVV